MGYEELQVRWMYSKLPETKAEVLKPLLPPESILLNVVLQRGRWDEYGILMTIDVTCKGTAGYHAASFFKDFIVITDAGMNQERTFGTGKVRGIIPYITIERYEIASNQISEDYTEYFLVFYMKDKREKFSFRLFEKRKYDDNFNYPWEFTPKMNGRDINFYDKVMKEVMADPIDYESRAHLLLKVMGMREEGFTRKFFEQEMGKSEEEFWKSVMKFLQAEKEAGNKEFGNIYDEYSKIRDESQNSIIEFNRSIKENHLRVKNIEEEMSRLQAEIQNLGRFSKNMKNEKLKQLSVDMQMMPEITRENDELKRQIAELNDKIYSLRKTKLIQVFETLAADDGNDKVINCVSNLIKATGKISIEDLIFIIDMLDWKHYPPTETEARAELTPLIAQGKAVYENGIVYDKSSIDESLLEEIEARKDEIAQETFDSCRDKIYDTICAQVIKSRVVRRQAMEDMLNREMMGSIECLSEKFNQEIIDMLINNGVMKDMNKIFVALK